MSLNNEEQIYKARFKNVGTDIYNYIFETGTSNRQLNLFKIHEKMTRIQNGRYVYESVKLDGLSQPTVKQIFNILDCIGFIKIKEIDFKKGSIENLNIIFEMSNNTDKKIIKWRSLFNQNQFYCIEDKLNETNIRKQMVTYIINDLIIPKIDELNNKIENGNSLERNEKESINLITSMFFLWKIDDLDFEHRKVINDVKKYEYLCNLTFENTSKKANKSRWVDSYRKFIEQINLTDEVNYEIVNTLFPMIKNYYNSSNIEENIDLIDKMFGENGSLIDEFDKNAKTLNRFSTAKNKDLIKFYEDESNEMVFPKVHSFFDFIGNLDYITIPEYQRKYKWGNSDNVVLIKNLLDDIINSSEDKNVLLGSIILALNRKIETNSIKYEIIDGQQRLTTLTLIYISMIKFADISKYNPDFFKAEKIKKFDFQNQYEGESDDKNGIFSFEKICNYDFKDLLNVENVYANAYREIMYWFLKNINSEGELKTFQNNFLNNVKFIANYNKTINSRHQYEIFLNANTKKEELKIWEIFETNVLLKAIELDFQEKIQKNTTYKRKAKEKLIEIKKILGFDDSKNNDLVNSSFSKYFSEYGKIIDKTYNLSSSNKIMESLSVDLNYFLDENKNIIEYIDHIIYYFKILSIFFNHKTKMNDKLIYVNDFVNTFCTKNSMIAFVIRILDVFSNHDILNYYCKIEGSFEKNKEQIAKINQARKVLFLLENYLIANEFNFNGTSFFPTINKKIKFQSIEECSLENVVYNLFPNKKLTVDEKIINNKLTNFKENNTKNIPILLYRIAFFVAHNNNFETIDLELKPSNLENWFPCVKNYAKLTVEHMFSQNNINVKNDTNIDLAKIEKYVYNFGNLTLLGSRANSSLKDIQLFKKMQHYSKQSEFTLVNYFDEDWKTVIQNAFQKYLEDNVSDSKKNDEKSYFDNIKSKNDWNNYDKYFDGKDYKNINLYDSYINARRDKYIKILCKIYVSWMTEMFDELSK